VTVIFEKNFQITKILGNMELSTSIIDFHPNTIPNSICFKIRQPEWLPHSTADNEKQKFFSALSNTEVKKKEKKNKIISLDIPPERRL